MARLVYLTVVCSLLLVGHARAETVDFEAFPPGTTLTNQYAAQGVVFGPLPGGAGDGLRPVVRAPGGNQAQSGVQVADIATCLGCEFFQPKTTGTFATPRSRVSVVVGYLGPLTLCAIDDPATPGCAVVTLRAFDAGGQLLGQASREVQQGGGVRAPLSVTAPGIVGFEISGRPFLDDSKPIGIDDLSYDVPTTPPTPDFTLNPSATNLIVPQGETATVPITIGRLGGSSGNVALSTETPAGIEASFDPNPVAGTQTTLTVRAQPSAPAGDHTIMVTGSPASAATGPGPRSVTLRLTVQQQCKLVRTAAELRAAVDAGYTCIFVANDAEIDMAQLPRIDDNALLHVPDGVTLMSGRSPTTAGGMLQLRARSTRSAMLSLGANTRLVGLRLRGYLFEPRKLGDGTKAVVVNSLDVHIENNEFSGWPAAGVEVHEVPNGPQSAGRVRITRNYFHHNVQCPLGYGVSMGKAYAQIDHNLFDFNRHDVAGSGFADSGYVAERNFALTSGPKCAGAVPRFPHYNQHFDMHGIDGNGSTAGTFMRIDQNTIRGAQQYGLRGFRRRRSTFWLRGTPTDKAIFTGNVVHHVDHGVVVKGLGALGFSRLRGMGKLIVRGNDSCVDTAHELGVGDFNGDGVADVFQSVGTVWVYSPAGRREWHILNDSELRLPELGLGDFDGNGVTDAFHQRNGRWFVSAGAAGGLVRQPFGDTFPMKGYRFHDFNGDGRADVFRASGSRWFFAPGAAAPWEGLATSKLTVEKLRFGNFVGDRRTDVFSLANNQWSVSDGGASGFTRLNGKLEGDLGRLVFADFDGNGRTDVARSTGSRWQVSRDGTSEWQPLRSGSENIARGTLFGNFDGRAGDDVLRHSRFGLATLGCGPPIGAFARYQLFPRATDRVSRWSAFDML